MKKLFCLLLVFSLLIFSFACNNGQTDKNIVFSAPDGAPALAFSSLIGNKIGEYNVEYNVVSADKIVAQVTTNNADVVIMPTNAGAKLYNGGVDIKLVTSNVFGLLYLVGKSEITSLSDLKGKTVYNIGQGNTPDYIFKYILDKNGISYSDSDEERDENKVSLKYVSDGSEALALLKQGLAEFAVVGEPIATQAVNVANCTVALDIQQEWEKQTGNDGYPQASVFVRGELCEDDEFISKLVELLGNNDVWVVENPSLAQDKIKECGSTLKVTLTSGIVSRCNLKTVIAQTARESVENYLSVLLQFAPKSIGDKLPDDGFYYIK